MGMLLALPKSTELWTPKTTVMRILQFGSEARDDEGNFKSHALSDPYVYSFWAGKWGAYISRGVYDVFLYCIYKKNTYIYIYMFITEDFRFVITYSMLRIAQYMLHILDRMLFIICSRIRLA